MRQSVLTLAADVQPQSVAALRRSILAFKAIVENPPPGQAGSPDSYEQLAKAVPALHFASMMIFEDAHYDPLLTVELNRQPVVPAPLATWRIPSTSRSTAWRESPASARRDSR
jgi:hypothetical protein